MQHLVKTWPTSSVNIRSWVFFELDQATNRRVCWGKTVEIFRFSVPMAPATAARSCFLPLSSLFSPQSNDCCPPLFEFLQQQQHTLTFGRLETCDMCEETHNSLEYTEVNITIGILYLSSQRIENVFFRCEWVSKCNTVNSKYNMILLLKWISLSNILKPIEWFENYCWPLIDSFQYSRTQLMAQNPPSNLGTDNVENFNWT